MGGGYYVLAKVKQDFLVSQWVKDLVLFLQQLGSLLCSGFDPWPGNFYMAWIQPEKKGGEAKKMHDRQLFFFFLRPHLCHMKFPS